MSNLSLLSSQTKQTAEKLLTNTNLINILNKYGEVMIGGSFKYNLMWGPDIDINVICDDPRVVSVAALSELIDKRLFQKYEYGDFEKFPREDRMRSFIMPLILPFEGQKWEVEVWFLREYPAAQAEIDNLIANELSDSKKATILKIKQQRDDSSTKHNISSTEIYRQVLKNNAQDLSDIT